MKKFVILGGAALGGLLGGIDHWYTHQPEIGGGAIILGVLIGAFVANWVWSYID